MAKKPARARADFRWRNRKGCWLHHAEIVEDDLEWLASVERLYLWNVRLPIGFLARLENLWWLDIRGGSGTDLGVVQGVKGLRYLAVNQVRGMCDLSVVSELLDLRYVNLYGLPQVTRLPSCAALGKLEHATLGQMRGLTSLTGMLEAPHLREVELIRKINVNAEDVERIATHPAIKAFLWFAEDVPNKVWIPVVERIGLPQVPIRSPEDWFSLDETGMLKFEG